MTRGQKIALGIGIGAILIGGIGFLAYRKFGKPRVKITRIDNANKEVHLIVNGNPTVLPYDLGLSGIGKSNYSIEVSKTSAGNVNGVNIVKNGAIVETITMAS